MSRIHSPVDCLYTFYRIVNTNSSLEGGWSPDMTDQWKSMTAASVYGYIQIPILYIVMISTAARFNMWQDINIIKKGIILLLYMEFFQPSRGIFFISVSKNNFTNEFLCKSNFDYFSRIFRLCYLLYSYICILEGKGLILC